MRRIEGLWYPDTEASLHKGHARSFDIKDEILPYLHDTQFCVQAGGAVGAWPIEFAKIFDLVYSFEPNPVLWECLLRNLKDQEVHNIAPQHCGLWKESVGHCAMVDTKSSNMGAWHIDIADDESLPPAVAIDDLDLLGCDLLQLDIEGAEIEALEGARETIRRCLPVIVVESKAVTLWHFKRTCEQLTSMLSRMRYKKAHSFSRDELWVPIS